MSVAVALTATFAAPALALGEAWNLITADFQTKQVDLRGIDETGVSVAEQSGAAPRQIPWETVLQLERNSPPKVGLAKFVLNTVGADQFYGEPVKIEAEALRWNCPSLGEISVPLRQIASMISAGVVPAAQAGEKHTEDVITLANGDSVRGIISDITSTNITVQSNSAPATVPLGSVRKVVLAATAAGPPQTDRAFRIRLAEGSTLSSPAVKVQNDRLSLTLPGGQSREIDIARVAGIEQVNGPVAWLSALPPVENVHTPFLETSRPARMDRTVRGEPIRFAEHTFSHGIGVYPYSRLTWELNGKYAALRTRYAIDGHGAYANVTVRILLDGQPVHERRDFGTDLLSPVIVVPMGSAKRLTLEVDFGQTYSVQDRFNWIETALVKTIPTTQP